MSITYVQGDLFDAPSGSVLGHACNCQGRWGSGVAAAFKKKFPDAFEVYRDHCAQYTTEATKRDNLLGTCLLIPTTGDNIVACLFTSNSFGRSVDPPESIVEATERAVADMWRQLRDQNFNGQVHLPLINAGLFRVPWEDTEQALKGVENGGEYVVHRL